MQTSRIHLRQIDFEDFRYALVPPCCDGKPGDELRQSIQRHGILHPPIVKEDSPASFFIVAGRKRLAALREASSPMTCDCFKLPADTEEIPILALALEEGLLSGPVSAIERATFFRKSSRYLDEKEIASRFLPLMGLTPTPYHIRRDLKLLELEEPLIQAIHLGKLDEKVAFELGRFSFSDRLSLFAVIDSLNLSVGNQKKLAVCCRELAARNRMTMRELLTDPAVDEIINHGEANIPQKTAHLMAWLNRQRFPRLSRAEKEFAAFRAEAGLIEGVTLQHSPSFEKDTLYLTLPCRDRDHFQRIWSRVKPLVGTDEAKMAAEDAADKKDDES